MPSKKYKLILITTLVLSASFFSCTTTKTADTTRITPQKKITPTIINHGNRDEKNISLTFDADMTASMQKKLFNKQIKSLYDKKITDTLEQTGTPATIFITGLWAQTYPEETKSISQNPLYEIANHSLTHSGFTKNCYGLTIVTDKNKELIETQKILNNLTGITPKYFRFPGGCYEQKDLEIVNNAELQAIGWDAISGDAFQPNSQKIINNVLNRTTNGSIIVMHLNGAHNAPATSKALPTIIKKLKEKGYTFVKLSELLKDQDSNAIFDFQKK
ncbi:polysaccharide deacetylase family protein [Candidatus Peregrinibacteria bacterium]|nr:polysaccharide deacetylase family protein [Candidatus Peregrinibacteria bacterium]